MKFTVLVAHDVPNYGTFELEARDADHALEILKAKNLSDITDEAVFDPAWDCSICARIVHMEDEEGNVFHEDTPLDKTYEEWSAVDDLVKALQRAEDFIENFDEDYDHGELLKQIRDALVKAGHAPSAHELAELNGDAA